MLCEKELVFARGGTETYKIRMLWVKVWPKLQYRFLWPVDQQTENMTAAKPGFGMAGKLAEKIQAVQ